MVQPKNRILQIIVLRSYFWFIVTSPWRLEFLCTQGHRQARHFQLSKLKEDYKFVSFYSEKKLIISVPYTFKQKNIHKANQNISQENGGNRQVANTVIARF